MNYVKIALSILTIAITVGPLLCTVYAYRDNLPGLVLPPSTPGISSLGLSGSNSSGLNLTALESLNPISPVDSGPTYNSSTGAFDYPVNFTNPLPQSIDIDNLSATIVCNENGATLATVSIPNPINLAPGQSTILDIGGIINQTVLQDYENQYQQGNNANVSLKNVSVTVGGVTLHIDDLSDFGSFQLSPSQLSQLQSGQLPGYSP